MDDKTVVYSTYYNSIEANIIKARIEDSGYACFLADENLAVLNPFYNQAIGGIKLIVFERDVPNINELLAEEFDSESFPSEANLVGEQSEVDMVCGNCNSSNVGYGMATKKKEGWWNVMLTLLLFPFPLKVNKCYHCYDCGYEFNN